MNVVITGSTKGIGLGMAREFINRGHSVMVSSRGESAVSEAVNELSGIDPNVKVAGAPCDVANVEQVQYLWDRAVAELGSVDIWINNAGRDGETTVNFDEASTDDMVMTINTNLVGLMNCNHVAIRGMKDQGSGMIWNMEGFGSNGQAMNGHSVYGSTKIAVRYFTKTLIKECKDTPVKIGYLSPGMVLTDMLIPPPEERDETWEKRKKTFNILADKVEVVTPWLVENVLANNEHGAAVRWLTPGKVMKRFLLAKFEKRTPVDEVMAAQESAAG